MVEGLSGCSYKCTMKKDHLCYYYVHNVPVVLIICSRNVSNLVSALWEGVQQNA